MLPGMAYRYGRSPSKSPSSSSSSVRNKRSKKGRGRGGHAERTKGQSAAEAGANSSTPGRAYLRAKRRDSARIRREDADAPSPAASSVSSSRLIAERDKSRASSRRGRVPERERKPRKFFAEPSSRERTPSLDFVRSRVAATRQMRASTFLAAFVRWVIENVDDLITGRQRLSLSVESLAYVLKKEHVPIAALAAELKADDLGALPIEKVLQFFDTLRATAIVHLRPGTDAVGASVPGFSCDVSGFTNIRALVLEGVRIDMLSGIEELACRLHELKIRNVDLGTADPKPILDLCGRGEKWTSLRTFQISNVGMKSMHGERNDQRCSVDWSRVPSLSTLDASSNGITTIAGDGFIQMKEVFRPGSSGGSRSNSPIASLPVPLDGGMQELHSLQVLDLSDNKISSMVSVNLVLGNVACLVLNNNQVRSTEGLCKLYALRALHLRNNQISEWSEVAKLAKLPQLVEVELSGNPIHMKLGAKSYRATAAKAWIAAALKDSFSSSSMTTAAPREDGSNPTVSPILSSYSSSRDDKRKGGKKYRNMLKANERQAHEKVQEAKNGGFETIDEAISRDMQEYSPQLLDLVLTLDEEEMTVDEFTSALKQLVDEKWGKVPDTTSAAFKPSARAVTIDASNIVVSPLAIGTPASAMGSSIDSELYHDAAASYASNASVAVKSPKVIVRASGKRKKKRRVVKIERSTSQSSASKKKTETQSQIKTPEPSPTRQSRGESSMSAYGTPPDARWARRSSGQSHPTLSPKHGESAPQKAKDDKSDRNSDARDADGDQEEDTDMHDMLVKFKRQLHEKMIAFDGRLKDLRREEGDNWLTKFESEVGSGNSRSASAAAHLFRARNVAGTADRSMVDRKLDNEQQRGRYRLHWHASLDDEDPETETQGDAAAEMSAPALAPPASSTQRMKETVSSSFSSNASSHGSGPAGDAKAISANRSSASAAALSKQSLNQGRMDMNPYNMSHFGPGDDTGRGMSDTDEEDDDDGDFFGGALNNIEQRLSQRLDISGANKIHRGSSAEGKVYSPSRGKMPTLEDSLVDDYFAKSVAAPSPSLQSNGIHGLSSSPEKRGSNDKADEDAGDRLLVNAHLEQYFRKNVFGTKTRGFGSERFIQLFRTPAVVHVAPNASATNERQLPTLRDVECRVIVVVTDLSIIILEDVAAQRPAATFGDQPVFPQLDKHPLANLKGVVIGLNGQRLKLVFTAADAADEAATVSCLLLTRDKDASYNILQRVQMLLKSKSSERDRHRIEIRNEDQEVLDNIQSHIFAPTASKRPGASTVVRLYLMVLLHKHREKAGRKRKSVAGGDAKLRVHATSQGGWVVRSATPDEAPQPRTLIVTSDAIYLCEEDYAGVLNQRMRLVSAVSIASIIRVSSDDVGEGRFTIEIEGGSLFSRNVKWRLQAKKSKEKLLSTLRALRREERVQVK